MLKKETQKDWMKSQVAHSIRGRLRLRVSGLSYVYDQRLEIAQALAGISGVESAQVTPCTESVLLRYDAAQMDGQQLAERADMILARYAMVAYRACHASAASEEPEVAMTTAHLTKRLAINAGALLIGNTVLPGSLMAGTMANFTSLEALASMGLTWPMVKSAWKGLRKDLRPNADFLTVTSIVASLLLGNASFRADDSCTV